MWGRRGCGAGKEVGLGSVEMMVGGMGVVDVGFRGGRGGNDVRMGVMARDFWDRWLGEADEWFEGMGMAWWLGRRGG